MFAATERLPGYRDHVAARSALGRVGTAAEVAQAVVALCTLDWVTGQIVAADGGVSLHSPIDPQEALEGTGVTARVHHSAIVVRDVEASLRFWRDGIGFAVMMDRHFDGDWPTLVRGARVAAAVGLPRRSGPRRRGDRRAGAVRRGW